MRNKILILTIAVMAIAGLGLLLLLRKPATSEKAGQVTATVEPVPVANQQPPPCEDKTYTVTAEDGPSGLWGIAEKEYGGRGYLNMLIAEASSKDYPSLATNPNFIKAGWVLTLPCCLCNLPALQRPVAAKPKPRPKKAAVPVEPECPACPPAAEAPKPSPAPEQSAAPAPPAAAPAPAPQTQTQTQTQTVVVEQAAPPQPAPQPAPAAAPQPEPPKEEKPPAPPPQAALQPLPVELPPPPKLLVGSAWNSFGQNQIEPGNLVNYSHVDVGVVVGNIGKVQIEPYLGLNTVKDTEGFSWNNRIQGEAGLKLVRPFSLGVVEVGGAYAAERRFSGNGLPDQTKTGVIGFTNAWFGWDQPTRRSSGRKLLTGSFPGAFQWRIGNISPFEKNNLIGWLRADQGFTLVKVAGISLVPTGTLIGTFDTDKNPWNRRYSYGGGLKLAIPWKAGVLDLQGGYQCTSQYSVNQQNVCGPGFSVNVWTGWRKRIGGE